MTDKIFRNHAPDYWAAGLPVIPLRQRNKMPDINQWSTYGSRMPTEIEMQHWLASFPKSNIGLPLGPASGLCMIDIDSEDDDLIAAILDILPKSPWVRVGKKGMGLAYQFEGQKNFKLRGADGGMIMEFLGLGNQMVMPPSIHPDTQKPYTANANLWDVLDALPYLGEDIEDKLRALLDKKGFSIGAGGRSSPIDMVPAGERDVQMVRHAGYLARVVLGIDKSLTNFSLMDALGHMHHWVANYTARVSGDEMDPGKGVSKLLEFLVKDVEKGRTLPDGWDVGLTDEMRVNPDIAGLISANSEQKWTVTRATKWFDDRLRENVECQNWATDTIQAIIERVAKDSEFTNVHRKALYGHIVRHCGKLGFTKRDLADLYSDIRKGQKKGELETQVIIAREVLAELQKYGEVRFDHGQFWQWSGSCFKSLDEDAIYMTVANTVKESVLARRHSDYAAVINVLERMCKAELAKVDTRGINFANGFVAADLSVADHDPKFGATFTLPFEYDRDNATRCPKFIEFLNSCWGDEPDFADRVAALQEMFAVTLFNIAPQYQRAFLLFGRAGTGKTVLLNILRSLLPPDAIAQLGPQSWAEKFHLVDLIGKAANIVGELPENGMVPGAMFKQVIEGSPCRDSFKNKDGFTFIPTCAHWFASNYLPVSKDTTRGFIRRWLILDFNKPVEEKDKIENLAEIIVGEEREAIAAWALEGLRRVLDKRGYTIPVCHEKRLAQMRRINNSLQAFLEDTAGIERGEGEMKAQELYDAYFQHIQNYRRGKAVSFERFMQMLEDLDLDVTRDLLGDYIVRGVRMREKAAVQSQAA